MKNYTSDFEASKEFIKYFSYDKERNLIIIEYASGNILPANCTKTNMISILKKMRDQIKNSYKFEQKTKNKYNISVFMSFLASFMLLLMLVIPGLPILLLATSIITLGISTNSILKQRNLLNDLQKNRLILDYSDDINEAIKSLNSEQLSQIIDDMSLQNIEVEKDKTTYMGIENIPPININSIEVTSLENVQELMKTLSIKPKNHERGNK